MGHSENKLMELVRHPVSRIVFGGITCFIIPILLNQFLKGILEEIGLSENINRGFRVIFITFIIIPVFYTISFKFLEKRRIEELRFRNIVPVFYAFFQAIMIIFISFTIIHLFGLVAVVDINKPTQVVLTLILILGLVITEEFFFRGILFRIIRDSWGTNTALFVTSIFFALLHLGNENTSLLSFISVILGGAVLGVLYIKTNSLYVPISFHFGWNLSQTLLGYNLSGGDDFNNLYCLNLHFTGSDLISGGLTGIENSVPSIIFLFIFFLYLYRGIESTSDSRL